MSAIDVDETGTLTAADTVVAMNVTGMGGIAVQVKSTYSGTITFEGSVDGITFVAMILTPIGTTVGATTTTGTGIWRGCVVGLHLFRARMSAYTSGAAIVSMRGVVSSPTLINLT